MKFMFVSLLKDYIWGGSEELWSKTASNLVNNHHEVVASVHGSKQISDRLTKLEKQGVKIHQRAAPMPSLAWRICAKLLKKEADRYLLERFRRLITVFEPDLICISNGRVVDDPRYLEVAQLNAAPVVNISQANAVEWWPNDALARRCAAALRGVETSFFVSKANLELWNMQTSEEHSRSAVVWNPFNVKFEANPRWPNSEQGLRLACVARLDPRAKGHDLLFKVLARPEWSARQLTVHLFGDGPCAETLKQLVSRMGLQDRVFFAGHVEDIEQIWANHHGLLLPSRYEGLPLALVEAMLCNRMAIVTNVAGNPEVVDDEVTGFIAPFPTEDSVSSAMERAWSRRTEWQRIGVEAGKRIRSKIPSNPAGVLADKLEHMVTSAVSKSY